MSAALATVSTATSDLAAFIGREGRLPCLGDAVPPWEYRGWNLPYLHGLHAAGLCGNRWGYLLDILETRKLPADPIPQVRFGERDMSVMKSLDEWARMIGFDLGGWSDFNRLIEWLGWSLGLTDEPPRLSAAVNEKLYRAVNLGPMVQTPYDYLGSWVSDRKASGWNPTAFYPTPHAVCECMVQMTFHDAKAEDGRDPRTLSVCDPCVGSGRMLLHAANFSLNLYGADIDPMICLVCKINGALYAPWIVRPIPAEILGTPDATELPAEHIGLVDPLPQQRALFDKGEPKPRKKRGRTTRRPAASSNRGDDR